MPTSRTTTEAEEAAAANFAAILATIRPHTVTELSDGLRELVQKVQDTGKQGSITLTLTVKPLDGDSNVLTVNDEIRVKAPEHSRKGSIAFPDHWGNLSRSDPHTMPLFDEGDLRTPATDTADAEIKEPPTA